MYFYRYRGVTVEGSMICSHKIHADTIPSENRSYVPLATPAMFN